MNPDSFKPDTPESFYPDKVDKLINEEVPGILKRPFFRIGQRSHTLTSIATSERVVADIQLKNLQMEANVVHHNLQHQVERLDAVNLTAQTMDRATVADYALKEALLINSKLLSQEQHVLDLKRIEEEHRLLEEAKERGLPRHVLVMEYEKRMLNTVELEKERAEIRLKIEGVLALRLTENEQWLQSIQKLKELVQERNRINTATGNDERGILLKIQDNTILMQQEVCDGLARLLLEGITPKDLEGGDSNPELGRVDGENEEASPDPA